MNYPATVTKSLKGSLLISSPMLVGEIYSQSIIFIYEHRPELGANGAIINHESHLSVDDLLEKAGYWGNGMYSDEPLYHGGLMNEQSVLMLHSSEWYSSNTYPINDKFSISSDVFMIEKMINGNHPDQWRMCAGQCSWYPDQLEEEIASNVWLEMPATPEIVFDKHSGQAQWRKAIRKCSSHAVETWF